MMKCNCLAQVLNLASKSLLNDMNIAPLDAGNDEANDCTEMDNDEVSLIQQGSGPSSTVAKV
jgi:hypothetical protein